MTQAVKVFTLSLLLSAPLAYAGLEFTDSPQQEDAQPPQVQTPPTAPVDAYVEMLKEDTSTGATPDTSEAEFQSVRGRLRPRRVVAAEPTQEAPKAPKILPRTVMPKAPTPKATTVMETETITPQGPQAPAPYSARQSSDQPMSPNAAFGYTHLLPGPFNLRQGDWVFGSTVAYGLFDALELSTNVVRTIQQQWNIQAKVPLIEYPTFMTTAYVAFESSNPHTIDDSNPDNRQSRWQPGLVTAFEIEDNLAFFLGGNFDFGADPVPVTTTTGYLKGARVEADLSWLYNPQSSRLGRNALSMGVTYDTTYELLGFGVTHHWDSFTLGVHYTLADRSRFLPIFGFQVAARF